MREQSTQSTQGASLEGRKVSLLTKARSKELQQIFDASAEEIKAGNLDSKIEAVLQEFQKEGDVDLIVMLSYCIFSGKHRPSLFLSYAMRESLYKAIIDYRCGCTDKEQVLQAFRLMFEAEKARIHNVGQVKNDAFKKGYWGQSLGIEPDAEVFIFHGGGLQYLQGVLKGEVQAYRLEKAINSSKTHFGIQVSPFERKRHSQEKTFDEFFNLSRAGTYADRSKCYFDTSATLVGVVAAKHLDRAPNLYEAGLRTENFRHIRNLNIIY